MSATATRPHPSKRLYDGEVNNFLEAMAVHQQQIEFENAMTEKLALMQGTPITAEERRMMKTLSGGVIKASEAMAIYAKHHQAFLAAVVTELRAKNDSEFDAFADAFESEDYSSLAI